MQDILETLKPLIVAYGGDFGIVIQVVTIIGSLRLINKPLFSFLRAVVNFTHWTESDNIFLDKVEASKYYKGLLYVLDWVASVKIKK